MTTYPDRSKCSTSRSAVIRAVVSSASRTRFQPLNRTAKERDCVSSSRVAGRGLGVSGMVGR